MREPEEVERLWLAETPSLPVRNCGSAKLDEPRLVGMKGEAEACEPCLKIGKKLLCLVLMLKADDGVVRVAGSLRLHRDGLAPSTFRRSPGAPIHT